MSWIIRVSGMEQIYKILVGEQSLGTPRHRWKKIMKCFLKEE
jgi:hypothetical protein